MRENGELPKFHLHSVSSGKRNGCQIGKDEVILEHIEIQEKRNYRRAQNSSKWLRALPNRIFSIVLGEVADEILEHLLMHQGKGMKEKFKTREASVIPSVLVRMTPAALTDKCRGLSGLTQ